MNLDTSQLHTNPPPPASAEIDWGQKALEYARMIAKIYPRGSATPGERQAAETVGAYLASLDIRNVHLQPFVGLRSIWLFLAMAFGLAISGHAAFWLLSSPLGQGWALLLTVVAFAFSAYLMWRKFTYRDYPLRRALPHGPSQNVLAILPAHTAATQRVVLVAHLDSHRAVWWFAHDRLVKAYAVLSPIAIYGLFLSPLLYALSLLPALALLRWAALVPALLHFLAWFTGITADLGPYSPGANDNASAVGTIIALAERLRHSPLKNTEIWLAFTGCEETGCDGMSALLAAHGDALRQADLPALFIDFELVGIGTRLVYLQSEGLARPRRIELELEKLVREVGKPFNILPRQAAAVGVFTESGVLWENGFKRSFCLLAQRPASTLLPEWHRLTDQPTRLEYASFSQVHRFAWELLQKIDDGA